MFQDFIEKYSITVLEILSIQIAFSESATIQDLINGFMQMSGDKVDVTKIVVKNQATESKQLSSEFVCKGLSKVPLRNCQEDFSSRFLLRAIVYAKSLIYSLSHNTINHLRGMPF